MRWQDEIGIDVPVHGEFERNDMVEYFGEQLNGFAFTERGLGAELWLALRQAADHLRRCLPRPEPMTLHWTKIAQRHTDKPVKGMLTGPVTILQWSFVRDDQPRAKPAARSRSAIRDEVIDLESAGVKIIQIDEAALREGLPIRK